MIRVLSTSLLCAILAAGALSCASSKPVAPIKTDSPNSPVWIHPELQDKILVPDAQSHAYGYTSDSLLTYTFHIQNQTDLEVWVRVSPIFYDESGKNPVYQPVGVRREALQPAETKPIQVVCNNALGRSVVVQVLPEPRPQ